VTTTAKRTGPDRASRKCQVAAWVAIQRDVFVDSCQQNAERFASFGKVGRELLVTRASP
jgi:hypothetical protein